MHSFTSKEYTDKVSRYRFQKEVRARMCVCMYTHARDLFASKSIARYFIRIFFPSKPMHEISAIALFEIYTLSVALTSRVH